MKKSLFLSVIACAGLAQSVMADITTTELGATVSGDTAPTIDPNGFKHYNLTITINIDGATVQIGSDNTNDIIDEIKVVNGSTSDNRSLTLSIRDSSGLIRTTLAGLSKVYTTSPNRTDVNLVHLLMEGDILASNPADAIQVSQLGLVDIGGDVYGNIIADSATGSGSGGSAQIQIDGDLVDGGIYVAEHGISSLNIDGSVVTTGGSYSEIWSSGLINALAVAGSFHGRLIAYGEGYNSRVDYGVVRVGADFDGPYMDIGSMSELKIGGNYDASMRIFDPLVDSSLIQIAGDINVNPVDIFNGAWIAVGEFGVPGVFSGQMVVNSDNELSSPEGFMHVEQYGTLFANYKDLPGEFGGGAFGVAPFNFHQRDYAPPAGVARACRPYQGEVFTVSPLNGLQYVEIEHYGPVYYDDSETGNPFVIEFKPSIGPGPLVWQDRSHLFRVRTAATAPGSSDVTRTTNSTVDTSRKVYIEADPTKNNHGFEAAGSWRIRLDGDHLKCVGVAGNPTVDWVSESAYQTGTSPNELHWFMFNVLLTNDFTGQTVLQNPNGAQLDDVNSWIQSPYEVNADGNTDLGDFEEVLESYSRN